MASNEIMLYPDLYYHIYNHGNANDNIFLNEGNYNYFLKRYAFFINPVADTLAYCLMPNHFHFIIQIKNEVEILKIHEQKNIGITGLSNESVPGFISKQFSNFFNSYSKAFNKMNNRNGKLFQLPFKRKQLDSDDYLRKAIHYVHSNPVHHRFVKDMCDWTFSSIHAYQTDRKTHLKKEQGLELFDGSAGFDKYHRQPIDLKYKLDMDF
jgi:putative transposase